ncbi:MAG: hypothetical protein ACYDBV_15235 [Nitrospiria bacterium]
MIRKVRIGLFIIVFFCTKSVAFGKESTFFGALGGWEPDSSTTAGWQGEFMYGGFNRTDLYLGASYDDKYFYNRKSYDVRSYFHYSRTGYFKVGLWDKLYDYPVATTPVPDSNSYRNVPSVELELGDQLLSNLRGSLAYEFMRPNFFYDASTTANNHKVSGELHYQSNWRPLEMTLIADYLRDPDPDMTIVDKVNQRVTVAYENQFLVGGGADLTFRLFEGGVLVIPNRDLDQSFDYSILSHGKIPLGPSFSVRLDYVKDYYSSQSPFTGSTAEISTLTFTWEAAKRLRVSAGGKVVNRPIQNETGAFITTTFGLGSL